MSTASASAAGKANQGTETDIGRSRNTLRVSDAVARVARAIWPNKTAAELAFRSKTSQRACEYWLARQTDLSADALAELLRSDAGLEILEAVIGDAKPKWWRQFAKTIELSRLRKAQAELRRAQEEHQRRLEQFELDF